MGSWGSRRLSERIRVKTQIPSLVREAAEIKEKWFGWHGVCRDLDKVDTAARSRLRSLYHFGLKYIVAGIIGRTSPEQRDLDKCRRYLILRNNLDSDSSETNNRLYLHGSLEVTK